MVMVVNDYLYVIEHVGLRTQDRVLRGMVHISIVAAVPCVTDHSGV
jgi:hypothetical protein